MTGRRKTFTHALDTAMTTKVTVHLYEQIQSISVSNC